MPSSSRSNSCLCGVVAVFTFWVLAMFASAAFAQDATPRHWDPDTAGSLLSYIEQVGSHGLDPADYRPAQLKNALNSSDPAALEKAADESFGLLAADLAIGHVRPGERGRYYIEPNSLDPALVARMIDMAITAHKVSWVLDSFAPQNTEYTALRTALAGPDGQDASKRLQLKVALERWRWLPRNQGSSYLVVNIPEYRLRMIEGAKAIADHKVIVGQTTKQTPQFATRVTGVILNPTWTVPQSIIAESVGGLVRRSPATARSRGFTWSSSGGHLSVVQGPGPGNSLGQIKLDMPNPLTVYLHDTPSKSLFDKDNRTFSHGCMRLQSPFDLAEKLLGNVGWSRARIDGVVASGVTTRVALRTSLPVYVVYLTAVPQPGGSILYLKDPYKLDAGLAARLN